MYYFLDPFICSFPTASPLNFLWSYECLFDRKLDVYGTGTVNAYFAVIQKAMFPIRGDPLLIHTLCQQVQNSSPLRILNSPYPCAQTTFLAEWKRACQKCMPLPCACGSSPVPALALGPLFLMVSPGKQTRLCWLNGATIQSSYSSMTR